MKKKNTGIKDSFGNPLYAGDIIFVEYSPTNRVKSRIKMFFSTNDWHFIPLCEGGCAYSLNYLIDNKIPFIKCDN